MSNALNNAMYKVDKAECGVLEPSVAAGRAQRSAPWARITAYDAHRGAAWSCTKRSNIINGTGSAFRSLRLKDLWADLGDGIYHRIVAIHSDTRLELDDFVDSVPGTIALTFWQPLRKTIFIRTGEYNAPIRLEDQMCLSIVGDGGAWWHDTHLPTNPGTTPTTLNISTAFSQGAANFRCGEIVLDDINIVTRSIEEASVFDGAVYSRGYSGGVTNEPVGRVHWKFIDTYIESTFHANGISIWHPGNMLIMNSSMLGTEQGADYLSCDRAYSVDSFFRVAKALSGHYSAGIDVSSYYSGIDQHFKGGAVFMSTMFSGENSTCNNWVGAAEMGNQGLLVASSEQAGDPTSPVLDVYSIGNLHSTVIPVGGYGQGVRVTKYYPDTLGGMTLHSCFDSFDAKGDLTNYYDGFGDDGAVRFYYPHCTPATKALNGGAVSVVAP